MDKPDHTEITEQQAKADAPSPRQQLLTEIGQKLILARQTRNEQLSIVVLKLKLRQSHLQALETGHWENLPDDIYALGFLRQYSEYLALDLENEIQRIKHDQYVLTRPLTFPDPPVAPSRKWAWITGAAFITLFIAFNILNQDTVRNLLITPKATPAKAEQHAPEPEEPTLANSTDATDTRPSGNTLETATQTPAEIETTSSPPDSEPTVESTPDTPESLPDKTSTATASSQPPVIIDLYAKPAAEAEPEETAATEKKPVVVRHFRFEAVTASVWLQIFLPDETGKAKGTLYKEVLLQKGYHTSVREAVDSLWITSGNPAALRIKVDDRIMADLGSLGDIGKVLRDYHFMVAQ